MDDAAVRGAERLAAVSAALDHAILVCVAGAHLPALGHSLIRHAQAVKADTAAAVRPLAERVEQIEGRSLAAVNEARASAGAVRAELARAGEEAATWRAQHEQHSNAARVALVDAVERIRTVLTGRMVRWCVVCRLRGPHSCLAQEAAESSSTAASRMTADLLARVVGLDRLIGSVQTAVGEKLQVRPLLPSACAGRSCDGMG
jgi:hypothetical protein